MSARPSTEEGGAPSWLFSFVDLAFLMLIGMTLMASDYAGAPDLGQMSIPKIGEEASSDIVAGTGEIWQLRVHPTVVALDGTREAPFELTTGGDAGSAPMRLDQESLARELAALEAGGGGKPLLAPHEDSRSQDFLDAAALIEEHWPSRRRTLVSRLAGR
jgi:hypothetical protein